MADINKSEGGGSFSSIPDTENTSIGSVFATEVPGVLSGDYAFIYNLLEELNDNVDETEVAIALSETNAAASAVAAANSASAADTSASNSAASASTAAARLVDATTQASNAASSASAASASQIAAAASAAAALSSENLSNTYATNAAASETAAEAALAEFNGIYLGAKIADPTVDNNGDPLDAGDYYFDSINQIVKYYDGTNWTGAASALVAESSPALGGNLDLNTYSITGIGNVNITGGVTLTGNVAVGGTVDGRDVATDGTKLDGVESGATADQTGAEIKSLYEAELDTNAFTDAEKTKLAGIEALADVTDVTNVTAAGALMDSELTSEASVKAMNQGVATTDSPSFVQVTATTFVGIDGGNATG